MNKRILSVLNCKWKSMFAIVLTLSATTVPLSQAAAKAAPATITVEQARGAAEEVAKLIEAHYVFPEKRQAIADAIRKAAANQRYDVQDPFVFGDRMTTDLRTASNDQHLGIIFDPDHAQAMSGSEGPATPQPRRRSNDKRRNHGFEELKILPGNIRYVKITNFLWTGDETPAVIDEVARFLGDGDAVIIDLRGNGGGNASAVARLTSYFMKDEGQVLMTFYDGLSGDIRVNRVADDLRAPRMEGKPLYTLIDDGTGSAAEEFAYHVQQFKLGPLVGEKTAGAANNNHHFPVAPGFVVSVSVGRPVHPVSKTNWDGAGIAPTDPVPSNSALDQAQLLALHRLAEGAQGRDQMAYQWALEGIEARLHPFTVAPRDLEAYAGKFGIRTIRVENGALTLQREGRAPSKLIPMAQDLFASARTDQVRVRFKRSGDHIVGFDQITDDGQVLPSERDH